MNNFSPLQCHFQTLLIALLCAYYSCMLSSILQYCASFQRVYKNLFSEQIPATWLDFTRKKLLKTEETNTYFSCVLYSWGLKNWCKNWLYVWFILAVHLFVWFLGFMSSVPSAHLTVMKAGNKMEKLDPFTSCDIITRMCGTGLCVLDLMPL